MIPDSDYIVELCGTPVPADAHEDHLDICPRCADGAPVEVGA